MPEALTPARRRQLARDAASAVPQLEGDAVYCDVATNGTTAWYGYDCYGYVPRNAYGWQLNCQQVIRAALAVPMGSANAAARAMIDYSRANPDLTSDAWCSNPPTDYTGPRLPYPWAGTWLAMRAQSINSDRLRVVNVDRFHTCWHCAYKAGLGHSTMPVSRPMIAYEWTNIDTYYMPSYEVLDDVEDDGSTRTIKDVIGEVDTSCGNCGRVGHRSPTCTYPTKAFDKVGVEIEGRWADLRSAHNRADSLGMGPGYQDGSIGYSDSGLAWEYQTVPGSIRLACQTLIDMYPDETDATCGMHVHVSFDAATMTLLNHPAFFKYFAARWEEWGAKMRLHPMSQFFQRLRGRNTYCMPAGDNPYHVNSMDRYAQLNFSSFGEHGTVECRLLPMFRRSSLGVAAIQELLDIYETYLAAPETFGHPGFNKTVIKDDTLTPKVTPVVLTPKTIDVDSAVKKIERKLEKALEMPELAPPTDGRVRISLPINQPITVQGLAAAVRKVQAA